MAEPRNSVTIDSLLDRYINPVVERQKEREAEAARLPSTPIESIAHDTGQIVSGQIDICQKDSGQIVSTPTGGDIRSHFDKLDRNICDVMAQHFDPTCMAIYLQLYRLSWGFQTADCTVTVERLAERSSVTTRTVRRTLIELERRGAVIRTIQTTPKTGNHYVVKLPHQIPELVTLCPTQPRITTPDKKTADKIADDTLSDDKKTADRVKAKMSCDKMSGVTAERTQAGEISTPDKKTADNLAANIEGTTFIENNNRDEDTHPVVVLLRQNNFDISDDCTASWVARGLSIERLQTCIAYVDGRKWDDSRDGALVAAVDHNWPISPKYRPTKEEEKDQQNQADYEERRRREEDDWVREKKSKMTPEERTNLQTKAEAECDKDASYRILPAFLRKHYVEAYMRAALLATRYSASSTE